MEGSDVYRVPVPNYVAALSDSFPRPQKERTLETGMDRRFELTVRPSNASNAGYGGDGYIDFTIPGCAGQFIDLGSIVLHVAGSVVKTGGAKAKKEDKIQISQLGLCTLFKSISVYFNNTQVEPGTNYAYTSYIKNLLNNPAWRSKNLLKLMGFRTMKQQDAYTDDTIAAEEEESFVTEKGFDLLGPLTLDIATSDAYLLDSVDIRIRLELSADKFLLNTATEASAPKYTIDEASLTVAKLCPMANAMKALSRKLEKVPMTYLFDRIVYTSRPVATGQTRITLDNPWSNVVPSKLWFVIVPMERTHGQYNKNSMYFNHHDIKRVDLSLNNETLYSLQADFENQRYGFSYYQFLRALGHSHAPLIEHEEFGNGSTVHLFSLSPEILDGESMVLEREGHLRINIDLANAPTESLLLMMFAETQGKMVIDKERDVLLDVRR